MDVKFESTFSLKLKETPNNSDGRCQLICTSPYGIVILAFQTGFHVFRTATFESACRTKTDELRQYPERGFLLKKNLDNFVYDQTINIPGNQTILFVSLCCDSSILAVVLRRTQLNQPVVLFYQVHKLFQQRPTPFLQVADTRVFSHDLITDIIWNPVQENRMMLCLSSGAVILLTLVENYTKFILQRLSKEKAYAISWSPRGKRIMIYGEGGFLEQYDAQKLTPLRRIDISGHLPSRYAVFDILWFNNFAYVLSATTGERDRTNPLILFVHAPKEGPLHIRPFEDVCFPSDSTSCIPLNQFYLQWCAPWRCAILLSNRASEIGILSVSEDSKDCSLIPQEEESILFKDGTRFTGFAMDNTIQSTEKGPLFYALTSDGDVLCQFMRRDRSQGSACVAPMPLHKLGIQRISGHEYRGDPQEMKNRSPAQATTGFPLTKPVSSIPSTSSIITKAISSPSSWLGGSMPSKVSSDDSGDKRLSVRPSKELQSVLEDTSPRRHGDVAPSSPATMRALQELVLTVSERIDKSLSANHHLFADIDKILPSGTSDRDMKRYSTPLTDLQTRGDRIERHLEALNVITREAHNNTLQLSIDSAANLEYIERITQAMKHRHKSHGGYLSNFDGPPIDPGLNHHLREMHSRIDNFEVILDQANLQLDSLLSRAESTTTDRRRQPSYGQSTHTNGMEDPKLHQLYVALRTNAGALSIQENKVGEITRLVDRLSLRTVPNGVSNDSTSGQHHRSGSGGQNCTYRPDTDSERSPVARRGWSTERDSMLIKLLNGRKDVPHVKSLPVNASRSDDEKALYRRIDFSRIEGLSHQSASPASNFSSSPRHMNATTNSQQSFDNASKYSLSSIVSSHISQPTSIPENSPSQNTTEKHVTFEVSNSTPSSVTCTNPLSTTSAPTSILKAPTDVKSPPDQMFAQNRTIPANKTLSPNLMSNLHNQRGLIGVGNSVSPSSVSISSASATASEILKNAKGGTFSPSPVVSTPMPNFSSPSYSLSSSSQSPVLNLSTQLPSSTSTSVFSPSITAGVPSPNSAKISAQKSPYSSLVTGNYDLSRGDYQSTGSVPSLSPSVLSQNKSSLSPSQRPIPSLNPISNANEILLKSNENAATISSTIAGSPQQTVISSSSPLSTPGFNLKQTPGIGSTGAPTISNTTPKTVTLLSPALSKDNSANNQISYQSVSPKPENQSLFSMKSLTSTTFSGSQAATAANSSFGDNPGLFKSMPTTVSTQSAVPTSGMFRLSNPASPNTSSTSLFTTRNPSNSATVVEPSLFSSVPSKTDTNSTEQKVGLFGIKTTAETSKSLFQPTSNVQSILSSSSPVAGSKALEGNSSFGKSFTSPSSTQPGSLFTSSAKTTASSLFPSPANTTANSLFSTNPGTSSSPSNFSGLFRQQDTSMTNQASTTGSLFNTGVVQTSQASFTSPFTQNPSSSSMILSGQKMNSPSITADGEGSSGAVEGDRNNIFGGKAVANNAQNVTSLFGLVSNSSSQSTGTGGLFGSSPATAPSLFSGLGAPPPNEAKNVFGSPMAAAQPSQPAGFQSLFGTSHSSPFGASSTPGGTFESPRPPAQTQSPSNPGFGAPPSFGGSPVFGGAPAFGTTISRTSGFSDVQPSGGFAAIANQGTSLTFGSLAQGSSPGVGVPIQAGFGSQPSAVPQTFGSPNTGTSLEFSGNPSFTRRRA